jgi:membrane protease YdiL (CAAX protease family)
VPVNDKGRGDDDLAQQLRGFGPTGLLAMFVILLGDALVKPLSAILVLLWARRSRTPWREIGYVRPRSWAGGIALGIVLGVAFKLLMKAIVMPLLGADPVNHAYHFLAGNPAALPGMIFTLTIGAGFGEETVFRGYLFERLRKRLGQGRAAEVLIVLLTTTVFALGHYPNLGWTGVQQAMFTGLVFGTLYAATGGLWMLMWAHAAFDLAALAIIYWDVETRVAHCVFT